MLTRSAGLPVRTVGEGLSELRIHHGSVYRIYFTKQGGRLLSFLRREQEF